MTNEKSLPERLKALFEDVRCDPEDYGPLVDEVDRLDKKCAALAFLHYNQQVKTSVADEPTATPYGNHPPIPGSYIRDLVAEVERLRCLVPAEPSREPDWKALLIKYVCHIDAAEGHYVRDLDFAPCRMPGMEFTDADRENWKAIEAGLDEYDARIAQNRT